MVSDQIIRRATAVVTERDVDRLQTLAKSPRYRPTHAPRLMALREALERADVVTSGLVPRDVVTMHSRVCVRSPRATDSVEYTLAYPDEADLDAGKLSVLAPIGMALLGASVGQVVKFDTPSGKRRLRVDRILYQPDSSGDLHL